jgi:hypothetical protein
VAPFACPVLPLRCPPRAQARQVRPYCALQYQRCRQTGSSRVAGPPWGQTRAMTIARWLLGFRNRRRARASAAVRSITKRALGMTALGMGWLHELAERTLTRAKRLLKVGLCSPAKPLKVLSIRRLRCASARCRLRKRRPQTHSSSSPLGPPTAAARASSCAERVHQPPSASSR